VHTVHWFPGNFIPQIPAAFIQVLSQPGDLILDPFAGSGTTAIESLNQRRRVVLSDRISACVMISHGKLLAHTSPIDRDTKFRVLSQLTWEYQCRTDKPGKHGEGTDPILMQWYSSDTLAQLRYLWHLVEEQPDLVFRKVLALLFSDVLFACASPGPARTSTGSRRRHHWGWVADNVRPHSHVEHNAVRAFEIRVAALPERPVSSRTFSEALVLQQDARDLAHPSDAIDLIVTSPPYIGVIDYTRANRLLYGWMGWPFDQERSIEIGARFKRRRLRVVEDYLAEMRECWKEMHRVLRRGAYCAIVIGESRRYPGTVDRTLSDLEKLMPRVWGPRSRNPSRRRVSERGAREAVEHLCVFRKT
jgi:hypothetical protein